MLTSATAAPLRVQPLPRPGKPPRDRRGPRPTNPVDALQAALDGWALRAQLDVVVIADEQGMIVARGGDRVDVTLLAAITPLVGQQKVAAQIRRGGTPREITVRPISVADETFYVAALGGTAQTRLCAVSGSAQAMVRLFG